MNYNFEEQLFTIIDKKKILRDEPMKSHTTFRVGGPADYFVIPEGDAQLRDVVLLCRKEKMPYYVLGNGSNLLVGDKGFRGVVIQIFKDMNRITVDGDVLTAQAGASLAMAANAALEHGLTGFEFAAGIPGTLGGATVMNAGAYGGELKDVLVSAKVLTKEGEIRILSNEELELGYRRSIIPEKGYIVLEASIGLSPGDKGEIKARMDELRERRISKQPLEYPSAGSTFKRPEGYFAGKLIQDAGLKGFTVGGAQVSDKHSGFVINKGDATAADIRELICQVSRRVKEVCGVELEPEVKQIGEF
ncbi:UDP-N-acetylmuramate dehydrogenase [Bariatricus massiliensis]|uniref:UDP-N-acetylenolpyruvoylglucosamine reductase n=1 Tax=Bariatricus massiliensis TaxID=1745713 RepID=A0ABS8DGQ7_9FIRM|nr:UDP-N-acetylmuramate dehydrogenase [Bariatricus massiliensis]MCB7304490.1 UDP-N-acetylmuramate dehydrogenase [Bariatricus massiliensis]MCB7375142.1 UDP-N-acetylmuramate dehydrogenase [Bariatricus massiliensis]MCB7387601.1 UDP-N-acetylmuramate dehydrogenase [Bariatricus massiliensis]MCB7411762.1 UDP-N-acetylmuramate dehydrogenase [Bariatricus massiliensis]MCQ5253898.1 UDP-N-acetylmuramate dehydrogenase [Bariatricus massiliensis]